MKFIKLILLTSFILNYCLGQQKQEAEERTITKTRPTQPQWKGVYELPNKVFFTNDFQGGRLNGIIQTEGDTITALITPENAPINQSAWYAFKIWSEEKREIVLKLTYLNGKHRYFPKLSKDGMNWTPIDSSKYEVVGEEIDPNNFGKQYNAVALNLEVGKDTLWVAGQELQTSKHVFAWIDEWEKKSFISVDEIGRSRENRPIKCMKIGNNDDKKMMLIMTRQHPPELTGHFAMQAFVEKLCGNSKMAKKFRKEYNLYVIPLVNPDGVDNGHWRHNVGGVDLNRDWADFNHPETRAVRDFMQKKVEETGGEFYFAVDFHSTQEDVYYTLPVGTNDSNLPGFTDKWLAGIKSQLPNYEPNVSPTKSLDPPLVSRNHFYITHNAESLIYEVGDHVPRDFVKKKAEVAAEQLMKIVLEEY